MTHRALIGSALSLLAAASLTACAKPAAPAATVDSASIADAVKADARQLVADFNAHDADKAITHDTADMVGMFHGQANIVGPQADLAQTKAMLATNPNANLVVSNESVDVAQAGDMAVYRSTYVFTGTDPKTKLPNTETGNWVAGYKKQPDGTWKMAWNVIADTPPPASAASGAPAAK